MRALSQHGAAYAATAVLLRPLLTDILPEQSMYTD